MQFKLSVIILFHAYDFLGWFNHGVIVGLVCTIFTHLPAENVLLLWTSGQIPLVLRF